MDGPLTGVRVIDLSATFMGPYCTLILADLGADVVKVEPPAGDLVRNVGARRHEGMAAVFLNANRGKRSIVLDLKQPEGRAVLDRLIDGADVFVHTMRPKAAAALAVDGPTIHERNPACVYCQIHGASVEGPYGNMPAYDDVVQAAAGIAALQGAVEGTPRYVVTPIADKVVGMAAAYAILGALVQRGRTGEGQIIDVPMVETMVAFTLLEQLDGRTFEPPAGTTGYARTLSANRRPYATADGYIAVLVYTDAQWRRFFELADRADLADDPRFADIASRNEHTDELYQVLESLLLERTTDEWLAEFQRLEIPAMPVNELDDLFDDPHLEQVSMFELTDHPTEGKLRTARFPIDFSGAAVGSSRPAPRLGEHSAEILAEAGCTADEIRALLAQGITASPPDAEPGAT